MKIIKNDRNALSNLSKLRFLNLFVNKTRKIAIKGMSSKLIPKKFKPKFEGINKVIAKIDRGPGRTRTCDRRIMSPLL